MIYIKADALQDGLYQIQDGQIHKYKAKGGTVRTYEMGEIVRCRDCKHTITRPDGEIYCKKLDMEEIPVSHFCGWGERKDDEA